MLAFVCSALISSSAFACQLTITNDYVRDVIIKDVTNNNQKPLTIVKGQVYVFPKEQRQDFIISEELKIKNGYVGPKRFRVQQYACSAAHAIKLNVSDIMKKNIDTTLFKYIAPNSK